MKPSERINEIAEQLDHEDVISKKHDRPLFMNTIKAICRFLDEQSSKEESIVGECEICHEPVSGHKTGKEIRECPMLVVKSDIEAPQAQEKECHCGKDGHALNSVNCPKHGTVSERNALIDELVQELEKRPIMGDGYTYTTADGKAFWDGKSFAYSEIIALLTSKKK